MAQQPVVPDWLDIEQFGEDFLHYARASLDYLVDWSGVAEYFFWEWILLAVFLSVFLIPATVWGKRD